MNLRIVSLSPDVQEIQNGTGKPGIQETGFLQTPFWGLFKRSYGWKDQIFIVKMRGDKRPILVLVKKIARVFSFAYVPDGPSLDLAEFERGKVLAELAEALRLELPRNCMFIRFDPPWSSTEVPNGTVSGDPEVALTEPYRPYVGTPLRRAVSDIQPPDTVLLALGLDEDELLAAMKPKWRYNIRLAAKKGVVIEEIRVGETSDSGKDAISRFYGLYKKTAERDRIALHPLSYYETLAWLAAENKSSTDLRIWIAKFGTEDLAAIITLFMNLHAVYLYGASSDSYRNLMPAYALQWAAIRAARTCGCKDYDFYGIPPTADPAHPMAGLYRFKTGFGGIILHKAGSWDYPFIRAAYSGFRLAEGARKLWFKKIIKLMSRRNEKARNPVSTRKLALNATPKTYPGEDGEVGV